jgi:hypothetical protein
MTGDDAAIALFIETSVALSFRAIEDLLEKVAHRSSSTVVNIVPRLIVAHHVSPWVLVLEFNLAQKVRYCK